MNALESLRNAIPDAAKDLRLNLGSVLQPSALTKEQVWGTAVACAIAARNPQLRQATLEDALVHVAPEVVEDAKAAAALMGMNNAWYPYVEMAGDDELKTLRADLRMNAYATHGGVDRRSFELYALAASIVGKCGFCVRSHYKTLREAGMTTQQLRDVGRIAAVINAIAQVEASQAVPVAVAA